MRGLIFSKVTEGHGPGGMQRHLSWLVEWLAKAGWQSTIITTTGGGFRLGIPMQVLTMPHTRPGRYSHRWWTGTRELIRRTALAEWDVIISENGGAWSVIDEIRHEVNRPPIVMFRHGTTLLNLTQNVPPRSFRKLLTAINSARDFLRFARPLSRYIDVHVAASPRIGASVAKEGGMANGNVRIVPIGVDLETFRPTVDPTQARTALGLAPDIVTLLWVGRDVPGKGIEVAIRSFTALRAAGYSYQLLLVVGNTRPGTRVAVNELRKQWTGSVCLVENAQPAQLRGMYSAADLELFPSSLAEGTPLVVMEALASGVPVLCSATPALRDLPPLREQLEWFVDKPSIQTWVDRIITLTTEPVLARAKQIARQLAERYCDQRVTERGTVDAVRDAIHARQRTRNS